MGFVSQPNIYSLGYCLVLQKWEETPIISNKRTYEDSNDPKVCTNKVKFLLKNENNFSNQNIHLISVKPVPQEACYQGVGH